MPYPTAPSPPAPATSRTVLAVLILGIAVFSFGADDWELKVSKHYWSRGFYYGGYALQYQPTGRGLRAIHTESAANLTNLAPLTYIGPTPWPRPIDGFPGTERLLAPLMVSVVLRATREGIDPSTAFWLVNIALWMASTVLIYLLARHLFRDERAALLSALLLATYPVFVLTVAGLKVQHLGTTYLLAGAYYYERHLQRLSPALQAVGLLALFWVGMFSSGGWLLLAVYFTGRLLWLPARARWVLGIGMLAALALARYGLAELTELYKLPSVEQSLRITGGQLLMATVKWLQVWAGGGDVTAERFLNYDGYRFFTQFLPVLLKAFLQGHWVLLLTAGVAAVFCRPARMFVVIAVPMFFAGHAGTMMTGWLWHYGYLSAPAAVLLMLAASYGLARLVDRPSWPARLAAATVLLLAIGPGFDLKTQAGLYWSGNPLTYQARTYVYAEDLAQPEIH